MLITLSCSSHEASALGPLRSHCSSNSQKRSHLKPLPLLLALPCRSVWFTLFRICSRYHLPWAYYLKTPASSLHKIFFKIFLSSFWAFQPTARIAVVSNMMTGKLFFHGNPILLQHILFNVLSGSPFLYSFYTIFNSFKNICRKKIKMKRNILKIALQSPHACTPSTYSCFLALVTLITSFTYCVSDLLV